MKSNSSGARPRHSLAALLRMAAACVVVWGLAACDVQRISELEEGVSTEADVRQRFGAPEAVWDGPAGSKVFEYNRQPAGHRNYQITMGADGKMLALRQVLTTENFARVQVGQMMEDVRRTLGRPKSVTNWPARKETEYEWRYLDGPNTSDSKVFTVVFDADMRVVRTASIRDPDLDAGGR